MRHLRLPAGLEDVGEADDVRLHVGERVLQGVAHPGLGGEVDHPVEAVVGEGALHRGPVGEVGAAELVEAPRRGGRPLELGEPRFLEPGVVIVVDGVDPHHRVAAGDERAGDVEADEAGVAGDEDLHRTGHHAARVPAPRPMA